MSWGSEQTLVSAQAIAGTPYTSGGVTLNSGESARVKVKTNSSGTTDSLKIEVQTSIDGGSEWTTVAQYSYILDATSGNDVIDEFTVSGVKEFRIVATREGSTDTLTTDLKYALDGISV